MRVMSCSTVPRWAGRIEVEGHPAVISRSEGCEERRESTPPAPAACRGHPLVFISLGAGPFHPRAVLYFASAL